MVKKRLFIFCLTVVLILSMVETNALAYSSVYYNNQTIKVALESMRAATLNITLNGDYNFNGGTLKSGTCFDIKIDSGKLLMNGSYYDSIAIVPASNENYITIKKDSQTIRNYHGSFIFKVKYGNVYAINTLNIEEYVKGVIGYEMSEYFHIEALKAQAVTSRTYGIYKIKAGSEFDVVDTETNQVYRGFNDSYVKVKQAVEDTRGEILFYNGYVIEPLFAANHGGYSEDAANVWGNSVAYLKSKKDDFDDYTKYDNSKKYDWTEIYTSQQLTDILNSKLGTTGNRFVKIDLSTIAYYTSGRVSSLDIQYVAGDNTNKIQNLTRSNARDFFGFDSSMYTVSYDAGTGNYTFVGHGSGHGLGMSQIGALNRALSGQTYKEILAFYYTGTVLDKRCASIQSATLSDNETLTSRTISLDVLGQNGSGPAYLYKYVIQRDGQLETTIDYSTNSKLSYLVTKPGSYNVTVYFKDALSQDIYDDKRTLSFTATGFGDINTDKNVDILDLVLISKNLNKVKDNNPQWNAKMDLEKDGVINMLDLAKAAKSFNVKY